MSDQRSPRISPLRIPVEIAIIAGSSTEVPFTSETIREAKERSTTTGSGRFGLGGWAPLAGFVGTIPQRTAWLRAWVSTRCRFNTVPEDRRDEGSRSAEYRRWMCRG